MSSFSSAIVTIALIGSLLLLAACDKASSEDKTAASGSQSVEPAAAPVAVSLDKACNAALAEQTITQCKVCHSLSKGDPSLTGPNLFGVYGRPAASLLDFAYSPALRKAGITWSDKTLEAWLTNPQTFVPNNRMAFGGVQDADARSAAICYLKALK